MVKTWRCKNGSAAVCSVVRQTGSERETDRQRGVSSVQAKQRGHQHDTKYASMSDVFLFFFFSCADGYRLLEIHVKPVPLFLFV